MATATLPSTPTYSFEQIKRNIPSLNQKIYDLLLSDQLEYVAPRDCYDEPSIICNKCHMLIPQIHPEQMHTGAYPNVADVLEKDHLADDDSCVKIKEEYLAKREQYMKELLKLLETPGYEKYKEDVLGAIIPGHNGRYMKYPDDLETLVDRVSDGEWDYVHTYTE